MGEQVAAGLWGCSSVGRAPALQAGGQGFESLHLHCVRKIGHNSLYNVVYRSVITAGRAHAGCTDRFHDALRSFSTHRGGDPKIAP